MPDFNLRLRAEFSEKELRGTAISLERDDKTGAIQISPDKFFEITYPSIDLQKALKAVDNRAPGRPIVLLGERGRGKSHIIAALHHAFNAPDAVEKWASAWEGRSIEEQLADLHPKRSYAPITVNMDDQNYKTLWEVLFARHPWGLRFLGRFEAMDQDVPSKSLIVEMLKEQPVALLLDELQAWYDGTRDRDGSGPKYRAWAFSFLRILSEIASEHPDLLVLVVSLRNTNTDSYEQLHRNHPLLINFLAPMARLDRQRLTLHRLFENRHLIPEAAIRSITATYRQERFRLIRSHQDAGSAQQSDTEVIEAWPFSPELLDVLEDQILSSPHAQGLRDLIRVLALIYRDSDTKPPIFTPADFTIDDNRNEAVNSLLDAINDQGQGKLYNIALNNLEVVQETGMKAPHLSHIMGALWMRSFSISNKKGATKRQLHLDITHDESIDDNAFTDELTQIVEHSFNIHSDNVDGEQCYFFKLEENPRSRLLASARNNNMFTDARDVKRIREELKLILSPDNTSSVMQVIVLGPNWQTHPWPEVADFERPERWETPVLLVLPKAPRDLRSDLGRWLRDFVPQKRNTVRFLLPRADMPSLYSDPDVYLNARAALLGEAWGKQYQAPGREFTKQLRKAFENRFDRYVVLRVWNFQQPASCEFIVGQLNKQVKELAHTIDERLAHDHFEIEAFEKLVDELAQQSRNVNALLQELREPPVQRPAIVYLGERAIADQLIHMMAQRKLALNIQGEWLYREEETEAQAYARLKLKAFKQGRELAEMGLGLPDKVGPRASGTTPREAPQPPASPQFHTNGAASTPRPSDELLLDLWSDTEGAASDAASPPSPWSAAPSSVAAESNMSYSTASSPSDTTPARSVPRQLRSEPAPSLKLIAQLEKWGLAANQTVPIARLEFTSITVSQLKQVLQKLPSTMRSSILEIELDEG